MVRSPLYLWFASLSTDDSGLFTDDLVIPPQFRVDHIAGRREAISSIALDLPGDLPLCERLLRLDKNFS